MIKQRHFKVALAGLAVLGAAASRADSGKSAADLLMQAAAPSAPATTASGAQIAAVDADASVVLNTPIARTLFAEWNASRGKNSAQAFEVNQWVRLFLNEKFEAAAHLYGTVAKKVPDAFAEYALAAQLYSLYRVKTPQTFFDEWMKAFNRRGFAASRASAALEESISSDFENWFLTNSIQLSPDAVGAIKAQGPDRSVVFMTLTAATLERKGEAAGDILVKLPVNSLYRPRLAQSVAVALARKNDLGNAAKVLKNFYEPWLLTTQDARKTSQYYLQIARLLYQAGSFEGAAQFYEKIPNGSPDFLTAREELAWCWLREGDSAKLRGGLKTLTSNLLDDKFQPEAYLVRAISNLKLCYHAEVEKDFADFLRVNQAWAKKIEANLKAGEPEMPRTPDLYTLRAIAAEKSREAEIPELKGLAERSIAAVLPAVGPQKLWTDALQKAAQNLETAKKQRVAEFRRQWKNDQATLTEAIRKMQFVKVELMSQMAVLQATAAIKNDAGTTTAALAQASGSTVTASTQRAKIKGDGDMVFPFDGVIWPDELFKLRSQSSSQCLGQL